jgi:hypothetical protein
MTQDKKNRDIDALVSSVRDLVQQKPAATPAPTPDDLLVLTPEMRIDAPARAANDLMVLGAAEAAEPLPVTASAAQIEAAVIADPDDWEIDGGEAFAKDAWAASAFTRHPDNRRNVSPDGPAVALDDAALRALIVQVLREELTGQTGEKISGNLRKLVRREIARVMAPQIADQGK